MTLISKFPAKYVERMKKLIPVDELDLFFENVTKPIPRTVRISPENLAKIKADNAGWILSKVAEIPEAFFITRKDQQDNPLGRTLEHFSGEMYIQSLSSMLPVKILAPELDDKILDMCAAPGSKTTFLSQKMENTGLLVCNEPSGSRSKKLSANLNRLGVINSVMLQSDGVKMYHFLGQEFDKILLDAPCSSEGFSRKDASFFNKMWAEGKIFEAAKLQKKLILSAFSMLKPGGTLLYSTCTSAPEENELVVQHLLNKFPEAEVVSIDLGQIPARKGITKWENQEILAEISENVRRIYPHLETDQWSSESFFVSLIRKRYGISMRPPIKPDFVKNHPVILKKNQAAEIYTRLAKHFGIEKSILKQYTLLSRDDGIYFSTKNVGQFCQKNLFRKFGLKIIDKNDNITTEFALRMGKFATKNIYNLKDKVEYQKWMDGFDLNLDENELKNFSEKIVLVKFNRFCVGFGKIINEKLKNKLDRDLIF
jgi:16S rRNA (cytosine1407-C5)-methyltransferase